MGDDEAVARLRELLVSELDEARHGISRGVRADASFAAQQAREKAQDPAYAPVACPCCNRGDWSSSYPQQVNAAGGLTFEKFPEQGEPIWHRCWWCLALVEFIPDDSPAGGHFGLVLAGGRAT